MRKILLLIAVISLFQFSFGQKLSVRELSDKDRESKISKDDYIKYKYDNFYQKPEVVNKVVSISEKIDKCDSVQKDNDQQSKSDPKLKNKNKDEIENRNVTAIGYQIGGMTLIGINYEIRFHDYFGFHLGGGFAGYTLGLKIHTNSTKNSSFFNISYKDGGFGLLSTGALEYGSRIAFSKKRDFGLHFQVGFGGIFYIDDEMENEIYDDDDDAPPVSLSLGIGFSW